MARLEDKTVENVCLYLEEHGFSESVIKYVRGKSNPIKLGKCTTSDQFIDEELNGDAIALGLASDPGPSWLKDIIPKLGLRLKVHNVLRSLLLVILSISYRMWHSLAQLLIHIQQSHQPLVIAFLWELKLLKLTMNWYTY